MSGVTYDDAAKTVLAVARERGWIDRAEADALRSALAAETKLREEAEAALAVLAANPHTLCDEHIARLTALGREANTALAAAEARATRAEGALREIVASRSDAIGMRALARAGLAAARALAGEAQKEGTP
jgi:hypothetical protein